MPARPSTLSLRISTGLVATLIGIAPVGPVTKVREALRLIAWLAQRWKVRLRH
jgi:hypothetical protein